MADGKAERVPATSLVALFDFDDTIIDGNSDTIPFELLAPNILETSIHNSELPWTQRIDNALSKLPDAGIEPNQVLESVSRADLPTDTRAMLMLLRDCPYAASAIISDSNTLYIDAVLDANVLRDAFQVGIWTNPAKIVNVGEEDGVASGTARQKITVAPYCTSSERRDCACPRNLCKGTIVRSIMEQYAGAVFLYCGDGSNDLCGARQLPSGSFVLPRSGFSLERKLCREKVSAEVIPWKCATQLRASVEEILGRTAARR